MDIFCPVCGEPWENDSLHDVDGKSYALASSDFRRIGCEVFGVGHNEVVDTKRSDVARMAYELLGDDMDGAASMFDDAEYFGMLD